MFFKTSYVLYGSDGTLSDMMNYQEKRFDYGIVEGVAETSGEIPLYMNADIMNGIRQTFLPIFSTMLNQMNGYVVSALILKRQCYFSISARDIF